MGQLGFPKTLKEFREQFAKEEDCYRYLVESRWPEGINCPRCAGKSFWRRKRRYKYICQSCGLEISPTAGTLLQDTHIAIQEWFWAAYLVATLTPGLSARQLQRQLNCTYRTAWYMLHRLRHAMVNDNRTKLYGIVEADETIIGGPSEEFYGRGVTEDEKRSLVFGAVEVIPWQDKAGRQREKAGRLRLTITENATAESIKAFLSATADPQTIIRTDGWRGYSKEALFSFYSLLI